jgi:sulfatase maturation enzyme AslB (radical SAM superfamily)
MQVAALPDHIPHTLDKSIPTFIVPAPRGCNLSCPDSFIERRKEAATRLDLAPSDYAAFITQFASQEEIGALCIQGYEPLLPESFGYTRAILEVGQRWDIPTSLVTNGTHLDRWIGDLAELRPGKIAVSIDAATHDKSRGKVGAFEDAMRGLRIDQEAF